MYTVLMTPQKEADHVMQIYHTMIGNTLRIKTWKVVHHCALIRGRQNVSNLYTQYKIVCQIHQFVHAICLSIGAMVIMCFF